MDVIAQLIFAVLATLANIASNKWGYTTTQKMMRTELKNKVDIEIYSAKVKELHDLRNADREELVALRSEVRVLRELHDKNMGGV